MKSTLIVSTDELFSGWLLRYPIPGHHVRTSCFFRRHFEMEWTSSYCGLRQRGDRHSSDMHIQLHIFGTSWPTAQPVSKRALSRCLGPSKSFQVSTLTIFIVQMWVLSQFSCRFDFTGRHGLTPIKEQSVTTFEALASGQCNAVFMWWDLDMDPDGHYILSCAPEWAHPSPQNLVIVANH